MDTDKSVGSKQVIYTHKKRKKYTKCETEDTMHETKTNANFSQDDH